MKKRPQAYLSSPVTALKPAYDVVVIGSGYGGSIAASRMARAGFSVCLLERGKEFQPGEYPENQLDAAKEMQFNLPDKHLGSKTGLYEFHVNQDINVFVGCGLGGTSLVNANVAIEPDKRVFDRACWPKEIKEDMASFERGMERAKDMLKPALYPQGKNGYAALPKAEAMKVIAKELGTEFKYLPINVNFENGVNHVGVEQCACGLCGDCVTGCNYGAKNTTLMNYLPDAKNHGASIFTEVAVQYLRKVDDKWLVYYQLQEADRHKFSAPPLFVKADIVILGAGCLGSTEILMKSQEKGLAVSDLLGQRFTGNGDVLGFGYNNDSVINGVGFGSGKLKGKVKPVGPCISGVVDLRQTDKLEDGFVIEEGAIPGALAKLLPQTFKTVATFLGKDTDTNLTDFLKERFRIVKSLLLGAYKGAMHHTLTFLVMAHDDGNGRLSLKKDRIRVEWFGVGKQEIFRSVNNKLKEATKALGGTYVSNPSWNKLMNFDLVTVHPLGGCVMADAAEGGVVNHAGQVFSSKSGNAVHKGLYVTDGAIIPCSLGVNPLLTISALAERACEVIARDYSLLIPYNFPAVEPVQKQERPVGIQFTETMTGFFSKDGTVSFEEAYAEGKAQNSPFKFTLTIISDNLEKMLQSDSHEAGMCGTVMAPALSPRPLTISNGKFNLFIDSDLKPDAKKMNYTMQLHTEDGSTFFFHGYKDVSNDKGIDMWSDTSTLFITVYAGEDATGEVFGKGILNILAADFAKQMTTMKPLHAASKLEEAKALKDFGLFFGKSLVKEYVG